MAFFRRRTYRVVRRRHRTRLAYTLVPPMKRTYQPKKRKRASVAPGNDVVAVARTGIAELAENGGLAAISDLLMELLGAAGMLPEGEDSR